MEIAHVGMYFPSTTIVCKPRVQNWACCREVISDRPMLLPASQAHLETTHWGTRMHGSCSVEHDHVKNGTPQEVNKRKESLPMPSGVVTVIALDPMICPGFTDATTPSRGTSLSFIPKRGNLGSNQVHKVSGHPQSSRGPQHIQ